MKILFIGTPQGAGKLLSAVQELGYTYPNNLRHADRDWDSIIADTDRMTVVSLRVRANVEFSEYSQCINLAPAMPEEKVNVTIGSQAGYVDKDGLHVGCVNLGIQEAKAIVSVMERLRR
jgi:hypothetical protein